MHYSQWGRRNDTHHLDQHRGSRSKYNLDANDHAVAFIYFPSREDDCRHDGCDRAEEQPWVIVSILRDKSTRNHTHDKVCQNGRQEPYTTTNWRIA